MQPFLKKNKCELRKRIRASDIPFISLKAFINSRSEHPTQFIQRKILLQGNKGKQRK